MISMEILVKSTLNIRSFFCSGNYSMLKFFTNFLEF